MVNNYKIEVLPAKNFFPTIEKVLADGKLVFKLNTTKTFDIFVVNGEIDKSYIHNFLSNFPVEVSQQEVIELLLNSASEQISSVAEIPQLFGEVTILTNSEGTEFLLFKNALDVKTIMAGGVFKSVKDLQKFVFKNFPHCDFSIIGEKELYTFNTELKLFEENYPNFDIMSEDFLFENLAASEINMLQTIIDDLVTKIYLKNSDSITPVEEEVVDAEPTVLTEAASDSEIKNVLYDEKQIDNSLILLLHCWLTGDCQKDYQKAMRDIVFHEIKKDKESQAAKIFMKEYFNESLQISGEQLFEKFSLKDVARIVNGKAAINLCESIHNEKCVVYKTDKTYRIVNNINFSK